MRNTQNLKKIFLVVLSNHLIYLNSKCQNHEDDFFKLCVLLKKSEYYPRIVPKSVKSGFDLLI